MRPPKFWEEGAPVPFWALALRPVGAVYAAATARRLRRPGVAAKIPVICVGNIHAGGTGKTPTAIAVVQRLAARGVAAQVVTRGHGGRLTGPVAVDLRRHTAAEVGDEPLLLAAFAPVWVARDRAAGVRAATAAGAEAVVLDDGFQNPSVVKDLSLVVVDAARRFGNGRVLPAGPLRESPAAGLARADIVVGIGDAAAQAGLGQTLADLGHDGLPRLSGHLAPVRMGIDWGGQRVFAFAGIGHPEKFFATLAAEGAEIVGREALDDHQPIGPALFRRLEAQAQALGAQMVTTEKDAVRLPADLRPRVLILTVRLEIDDWAPFDAAVARLGL
ncbi:tetraacyldisaccharide 4'-kinase [Rhodobacteraceae bacterium CCMM004]|nr:tetraacyldisaccharide 4'-kinase [Rhodobacteraceae bacterium CCMM004]